MMKTSRKKGEALETVYAGRGHLRLKTVLPMLLLVCLGLWGCAALTMTGAADSRDIKQIQELMSQGINVNEPDRNGFTALHVAAGKGYPEVVAFLLEHGADVNARDRNRWTPLHSAAGFGHTETALVLIEHGADVRAKDFQGWTPLRVARSYNHAETADLIKKHGGGLLYGDE
ncbi:MAG: ankyrin repeat domain-containing protein [Deltaproteobacteria bacterium]|nr:ankyrin repeat domain-containing protein [Deltaproteobacteria bacterium]